MIGLILINKLLQYKNISKPSTCQLPILFSVHRPGLWHHKSIRWIKISEGCHHSFNSHKFIIFVPLLYWQSICFVKVDTLIILLTRSKIIIKLIWWKMPVSTLNRERILKSKMSKMEYWICLESCNKNSNP